MLAGARRVLVIGSETLSHITDWDDRSLAVLVGDGAGAVVLEATDGPGELLAWDLGADGSLRHLLSCDHGGYLFMNGKEIFRHAVRVVVDSSRTVLERIGAGPEDVDLFIPHQANARIIAAAGQRLGIPEERWVVTIDRYGNTSSASIPLALYGRARDRSPAPRRPGADLGVRRRDDVGERPPTMGRVTGSDAADGPPALVVLAAGMAKRYGGCKPLAPVGLHGEAVIDLTAGDALAAGFGPVVLVLGPQTGAAIRYHVRACFPPSVDVTFAEQAVPLGTAHAVLCARRLVGDGPFAVVNSDDVYGTPALALLAQHLAEGDEHAIVSYRLADTIVTDDPVTRGTCTIDDTGHLERLVERRSVTRRPDGGFAVGDGAEPAELPGDTPVSMNLWGFQPSIWPVLEAAVRGAHPSVDADGTVTDPSALDERGRGPAPRGGGGDDRRRRHARRRRGAARACHPRVGPLHRRHPCRRPSRGAQRARPHGRAGPAPRSAVGGGGLSSGPRRAVFVPPTPVLLPRPRRYEAPSDGRRVPWREPAGQRDGSIPAQGYRLEVDDGGVRLAAPDEAGLRHGRATLAQLRVAANNPGGEDGTVAACRIEDWPDFAVRGVMLDVARDRVPSMPTLFALVERLAGWKLNQLQLYMEHTFAYAGHEEVWRDADPYTGDDLEVLDAHCRARGIELVANQNTLGHFERWLRHDRYRPLAIAPDGFEWVFGIHRPPLTLDPAQEPGPSHW